MLLVFQHINVTGIVSVGQRDYLEGYRYLPRVRLFLRRRLQRTDRHSRQVDCTGLQNGLPSANDHQYNYRDDATDASTGANLSTYRSNSVP